MMQMSRMYPDACVSTEKRKKYIRLIAFVILSAVIFGYMANELCAHADGWGNPSSSIYGDDLGEEAFKNDADPNEEGSKPNWFIKIICDILAALGHGIFAMLSFCHANLDRLVFGRVMGGSTSNVAYYTFELQANNPYGAVGSLVYNIIRGVIYVLVAVMFGAKMAGAAWKRGRGASTIAAKEAVKSAAFVILALALMPNVLDLMLYLRDLLLYAIAKGVYGNSYFSGSASIITAFRDLVTEAENGESAGALILNTIMYDALGVLNVVYVFVYIGVALNMTVLFIMFPISVLKSMYDKRTFGQWLSVMLACILVPVGDTALLAIPCYLGKNFAANFGGSSSLALGLVQIGCCMMLLQARNMVKQSIGVSTGLGEGSGIHMGMMAARSALNAGMKGFSKVRNGLKSAKEDDTNAKIAEANSQIDDREMAEHMAKERAGAISSDENPATGNVKNGPIQTEKAAGREDGSVHADIDTDDAGTDVTGTTNPVSGFGEMAPVRGTSLEEDRGDVNAAGAWDMASSIAKANMEKNVDDSAIKKENETDGEMENAAAATESINSRNARTQELMDSMEDNPARLAQELGELEAREQEAVRGREMLAAEHEENGRRLEDAETTTAGFEKARKEVAAKIADTDSKISSLENERESGNAGEERKMEIESELDICRKTKEKLEDDRADIEKNLGAAVQDIESAREAYDISRTKLDELTGITAQKEDVRKRYDNAMDTARDMQGALLERRSELVRANSMNEGRLSGYSEGERQSAWAAVRAEEALQTAKADYDDAVAKGLPESVVNERRDAYQTARHDYSEKKATAPDVATDICRNISRDNAELARVNGDLGQLSTVIQETDPAYGQMDAGQIQSQISQNKFKANELQKNINNTKSRMQLLERGDVEERSKCINMIAQCENAKLDLENQNIVLQGRLNGNRQSPSGKGATGTASFNNMKGLDYSDKYMQERKAVASRYANLDNFENPEVSKFLTNKQKAEFYRKRAAVKRTRAVAGAVGAAAGAVTGAGAGMFLGTYGAEMLGEFGGTAGAALTGRAAEAVAGRTSVYSYKAGNLPSSFRTGNSFTGSPQNMTDAQRNADISEICSDLKDFSVNQVITSPSAINSFTRRAEARLHDLAVEIESRYPGDSQKQQEEFQKQMVPTVREELRRCVIREALSGRHTMINKGYLEKSEVYRDIEDGFMEEYFRVQSLNNINGYLQNGEG